MAVVVVVGAVFAISKLAGKSSSASKKSNVENPLEDDKYDEITDVVNNYLNAYLVEDSQKRLDILARYVDNIGDLSESDVAQKKYITSYSEVECYTKMVLMTTLMLFTHTTRQNTRTFQQSTKPYNILCN